MQRATASSAATGTAIDIRGQSPHLPEIRASPPLPPQSSLPLDLRRPHHHLLLCCLYTGRRRQCWRCTRAPRGRRCQRSTWRQTAFCPHVHVLPPLLPLRPTPSPRHNLDGTSPEEDSGARNHLEVEEAALLALPMGEADLRGFQRFGFGMTSTFAANVCGSAMEEPTHTKRKALQKPSERAARRGGQGGKRRRGGG